MNSSRPTQPWLRDFFALAAIWGSSFLFMRLAGHDFGVVPTVGGRVVIGALFLMPILLYKGLWQQLRQHWKKTFLVGLINSALPFACFSFALLSLSTGMTSILNATVPLFGALIAWLWLKDRPHGLRILGLVIGFFGIALLAWEKASFQPHASGLATGWAVLACLLACVSYGVAASYTKRYLGGLPSLVTATGSQLGASLGLALPTLWFWPAQAPGTNAWLAMLALGIMCTGVAYVLYFRLIENVGPARSLTVTFAIPVFAVIYGIIFLGESVSWWMLLCGLIIVCGTALSAGLVTRTSRGRLIPK